MGGDLENGVQIPTGGVILDGDLVEPPGAAGAVVFAHGSGSSRHSPRNRMVAARLQAAGYATLLMDLLTSEEEQIDDRTRKFRFDIPRLASRLVGAIRWRGIGLIAPSCRWRCSAQAQAQRLLSWPLRRFPIMFG